MLNIEIQSCGLILDLILIYFLKKHEKSGLRREKIFRISLAVNTVLIFLDILSVVMIVNADILPSILVNLVCKFYLVSLVSASFVAFVYCYSDVNQLRVNKVFQMAQSILYMAGVMLILLTPVLYTHENWQVYSYGPAASWTYVFAPLYIISTFSLTIIYGKQMNAHRKNAVRVWMILTIVAAVIQFVFPQLLLVGFASSLGVLILYAELENPEENMDRGTGVFNFTCFEEYLVQLFENDRSFSCVAVCPAEDLHVGHDKSGVMLLELATYLHGYKDAKVFRGLGNDFVMVYESSPENGLDCTKACNDDMQFIKQRFEQPFGQTVINASFLYMPDHSILKNSDELVQIYQSYRHNVSSGRGNVMVINADALSHTREFESVKQEILDALEENRIEVFLQPIYSLRDKNFTSAEALARLRNRDGSIMMPGKFIPIAEEAGLIEAIGDIVFRQACAWMQDEEIRKRGVKYIEVNLSISQCENEELAERYHGIMKERGLKPESINLEITESSSMNNRDILLGNMDRLRNAGVGFSLDDFGTGESNLNYIVDMPVDIVKFDHSMIQDYFRSERARIVMLATVRMIKELGLRIVAEGVETKAQFEEMEALGIDYIQGFYFSRPLPYTDFIHFISERNT